MYYISATTAPVMAPPTDRQVQIAELRNKGLTQEQIAKELGIARSTVAREWAAVKSEMSDLPLRYEEPKVIEPENDPKLSNSIVVELNGLDFEKFRESNILYVSNQSVFEARGNNIVHTTSMYFIPMIYYIPLSQLSLKHSCDATWIMSKCVESYEEIVKSLKPEPHLEFLTEFLDRHGRKTTLAKLTQNAFRGITSGHSAEALNEIYNLAWQDWEKELEEHNSTYYEMLNTLVPMAVKNNEIPVQLGRDESIYEMIFQNLPNHLISQDFAFPRSVTYHQNRKKNRESFLVDRIVNYSLLKHGIREDEIPLAMKHKIANPQLLNAFLRSGAENMDEYNKLIEDGFESTHDRDECAEMLKVIDEMPPIQNRNEQGGWLFPTINGKGEYTRKGDVYRHLLQNNWTRKRLILVKEVQEMTQKRVDFVRGSSFIDAFSIVEWPDGAVIRGTLADFTRRVGLENLITWLTPECDFALMEYALNSGFSLHYPHARATFEALMKRNHIFDGKPDLFGPSGTTDNGFLQKHGLGWANSDLSASMYLVLHIVRNSHGKQIPLSNLLREATSEMRGFQYNNEQRLSEAITEHLDKYCVVLPNDIVQIKGRKKQPLDTTDVFEIYEQERQKAVASILTKSQTEIHTKQIAKQLGVVINELPSFFERVEDEEIDALRLARRARR